MSTRASLIAFTCYAGISVWFHWPLVRAPGTLLPQPLGISERVAPLNWGDELMVTATIGTVARRLVEDPLRVHDLGQCHPFPDSLTLGEPMFVDGLVATVPMALTGNPIVAKNVVIVLAPVLGGLFMFALLLYWTGSVPAALVAGFLFGFNPGRLADVSHPYVHGNVWAPLAILLAHRLFSRRRWLDAALLAAALALQMLESLYPALAMALVGGTYGVGLAAHHRRSLAALAPKLAAIAAFLGVVAWAAFGPYFESQAAWGVLQGRRSLLLTPEAFHFGGPSYPGSVVVALAAVAFFDVARRGRTVVFDPRWPLVVAAFLVYWLVVTEISVPFVATIPSLYLLAGESLPGVSAVRAVGAVATGFRIIGACLAGLGLAILLARRRPAARRAIAATAFLLAFGEIFFFPRAGGGSGVRHRYVDAKPSDALLNLLASLPPGPVLDFPPSRFVPPSTHYVFLLGFHGRPTSGCHSSFPSPMSEEVYTMTARLPDSIEALRLRALGFRSIVVHTEYLPGDRLAEFQQWAKKYGRRYAGLRRLGEADGHVAYAFEPGPPTIGVEALANAGTETRLQWLAGADEPLTFRLRNAARGFYRHPDPIRPDTVVVTWREDDGTMQACAPQRVLLPLALVPGGTQRVRVVPACVPPPGAYLVTLYLGDENGPVLARRRVARLPAESPPPA